MSTPLSLISARVTSSSENWVKSDSSDRVFLISEFRLSISNVSIAEVSDAQEMWSVASLKEDAQLIEDVAEVSSDSRESNVQNRNGCGQVNAA